MTTGTLIGAEVRRREDGALVRGAGRFVDDVIHTIENVSQFWTSPEEEFLKQPPYSRAWPPCTHC